jgi:hypothetical protein
LASRLGCISNRPAPQSSRIFSVHCSTHSLGSDEVARDDAKLASLPDRRREPYLLVWRLLVNNVRSVLSHRQGQDAALRRSGSVSWFMVRSPQEHIRGIPLRNWGWQSHPTVLPESLEESPSSYQRDCDTPLLRGGFPKFLSDIFLCSKDTRDTPFAEHRRRRGVEPDVSRSQRARRPFGGQGHSSCSAREKP